MKTHAPGVLHTRFSDWFPLLLAPGCVQTCGACQRCCVRYRADLCTHATEVMRFVQSPHMRKTMQLMLLHVCSRAQDNQCADHRQQQRGVANLHCAGDVVVRI